MMTSARIAKVLMLVGVPLACSTSRNPHSDGSPSPAPSSATTGAPRAVASSAVFPASAPAPLRAACEAARARAMAARGAKADLHDGRCYDAGSGAWLLDIERGEPGDALGLSLGGHRVFPAFVTLDGRIVRAAAPLPRISNAPANTMDGDLRIAPITDLDKDGSPDFLILVEWVDIREPIGTSEQRGFAFAFRSERVVPLDLPDLKSPRAFMRYFRP